MFNKDSYSYVESYSLKTLYLAGLLGTKFLPWTNEVSTCRKVLFELREIVAPIAGYHL